MSAIVLAMTTASARRASCLLLAATSTALACSPAGGAAPEPTVVLLAEPFDDDTDGWTGRFQTITGGELVWELPAGQSDARTADSLIAIETEIDDVTIETAVTVDGARSVGFGCAAADVEGRHDFYDLSHHRARDHPEDVLRRRATGDPRREH